MVNRQLPVPELEVIIPVLQVAVQRFQVRFKAGWVISLAPAWYFHGQRTLVESHVEE